MDFETCRKKTLTIAKRYIPYDTMELHELVKLEALMEFLYTELSQDPKVLNRLIPRLYVGLNGFTESIDDLKVAYPGSKIYNECISRYKLTNHRNFEPVACLCLQFDTKIPSYCVWMVYRKVTTGMLDVQMSKFNMADVVRLGVGTTPVFAGLLVPYPTKSQQT